MLLSHYTSFDGACAIAKSKTIWSKQFTTMEDKSEISYGIIEALKYSCESMLKKLPQGIGDQENLRNSLPKFQVELTPLLRNHLEKSYNTSLIFITSFTKHATNDEAENGNLNHWRNYSGLDGVCLQYTEEQIKKLVHFESDYTPNPYIQFGKVTYGSEQLEKKHINIITHLENELFKSAYNKSGERILLSHITKIHNFDLNKEMLELCTFHKHPSFKDEREWRIVTIPVEKLVLYPSSPPQMIPFVNHRKFKWLNLGMYLQGGFVPSNIIIGPKFNDQQKIEKLRSLLGESSPSLKKSKIPI